jgi:hypothetical protein
MPKPPGVKWKTLVYFMDIRSILQPFGTGILWTFGIDCGNLVYFSRFGMLFGGGGNLATLECK